MEYRALSPLAMFSFAQLYNSSNVDGLDVIAIWSCIACQWHVLQRIQSLHRRCVCCGVVLCIHNLVYGDVVDPQSGLWRCGGSVVKV